MCRFVDAFLASCATGARSKDSPSGHTDVSGVMGSTACTTVYRPCATTFKNVDSRAARGVITLISAQAACCARRPRPNEPQVLAGTVPCPECMGHPVVHRHTPNLLRLFNLDDPLFFKARAAFFTRPTYTPPWLLDCGGAPSHSPTASSRTKT